MYFPRHPVPVLKCSNNNKTEPTVQRIKHNKIFRDKFLKKYDFFINFDAYLYSQSIN